MYSVTRSFGLRGLSGFAVAVEADVSGGLPAFSIVGLPDSAVRESADRVRAAIKNLGFKFPDRRITVNLAPADVRKTGPVYDLPLLLAALKQPDSFTRQNETAHFTASAWVVNPARNKVLMIYHNIYNSWSWTGGHADGETDLLAVALREVAEETGLQTLRPVSRELFSVEILTVDGHEKRGRYVPSHLHLNCTYLIEADDTEPLRVKPDENSGVRWFAPREALAACTEPWMRDRIYQKLIEKNTQYK